MLRSDFLVTGIVSNEVELELVVRFCSFLQLFSRKLLCFRSDRE